jgi:hypothetical protein
MNTNTSKIKVEIIHSINKYVKNGQKNIKKTEKKKNKNKRNSKFI